MWQILYLQLQGKLYFVCACVSVLLFWCRFPNQVTMGATQWHNLVCVCVCVFVCSCSVQDRNGQNSAICCQLVFIITTMWGGRSELPALMQTLLGPCICRQWLSSLRTSMIDFHLTGRIIDKRMDKIILKNKPLPFLSYIHGLFLALLPLYPVRWSQRAPVKGKKQQWSFPLLWNSQATLCLCVWFSLYSPHSLSLSLPFPPSPSAVTEQTGQVINSGATTLNLSCRQGCFSSPFGVFRCAPATLGFRQTKHHETVKEIY